MALSIRRDLADRAASASSASRPSVSQRLERVGVDELDVLRLDLALAQLRARGGEQRARRRARLRPHARAAARSASGSASARVALLGAESSALRLDIARPSGSRTVGQTWMRTGRFRSATSRRITSDLLSVLLSEVGDVGHRHSEQLRDDRAHAAEVLGAARGALEPVGQAEDLDGRREARADRPPRRTARTADRRRRRGRALASSSSRRG